jgi:hypothetical protein
LERFGSGRPRITVFVVRITVIRVAIVSAAIVGIRIVGIAGVVPIPPPRVPIEAKTPSQKNVRRGETRDRGRPTQSDRRRPTDRDRDRPVQTVSIKKLLQCRIFRQRLVIFASIIL